MCSKIRCDEKSWKFLGFGKELNKALDEAVCKESKALFSLSRNPKSFQDSPSH